MEASQVAGEILLSSVREKIAVARILELNGFGGRTSGELMALGPATEIGSLMFGSITKQLRQAAGSLLAGEDPGINVEITLGDADAVDAGLACGGLARVALSKIDGLLSGALSEIAARSVVAIATDLATSDAAVLGYCCAASHPVLAEGSGLSGAVQDSLALALRKMADTRRAGSWSLDVPDRAIHIEVYSPASRCLVIGSSELANAIAEQFELLGVSTSVCDTLEEARSITAQFASNDAVVLLSHDHEIGVPLFSALLKKRGIYLGALGSRHTQQVRRDALLKLGHGVNEVDRIYGPVGLDLGAKTPSETAVAIAAEFLAHRADRGATSLRSTRGSING